MKKLSYFIATALIGSSLSAAHAEPKMSGHHLHHDRGRTQQ